MTNEPLKVQQPLLESSNEIDKLRCTALSPVTKITVNGTNFPSREFRGMESFNWLTLCWLKYSMKLLKKSKNAVYWFLRRCRKTYFCENLQIKSAHFCKDLADLYGSSRFSATIFAEPCRKNPADLHRFAKIENLGSAAFVVVTGGKPCMPHTKYQKLWSESVIYLLTVHQFTSALSALIFCWPEHFVHRVFETRGAKKRLQNATKIVYVTLHTH